MVEKKRRDQQRRLVEERATNRRRTHVIPKATLFELTPLLMRMRFDFLKLEFIFLI